MAKDPSARLERFAAELERGLGENLVAFCLYGPGVRRDVREKNRELTTLLIVRDVSAAALHPAHHAIAQWAKEGNPPPLVFEETGWRRSADVFPIEIEDMREAHRLLRGRDPFAGMTIDRADLRRELEHEVRGKVLRLRTEYAAAAPNGKALEELLLDSAGTFFVLLRAVLRLVGRTPPQTPRALVTDVAAAAKLDAAAFDWVTDKLVGHNVPALKPFDLVAERYLAQIERVVRFVDEFDPARPAGGDTKETS
jgi:hypothetical protein